MRRSVLFLSSCAIAIACSSNDATDGGSDAGSEGVMFEAGPCMQTVCNGKCTDPMGDVNNCGACGKACSIMHAIPSCNAGQCKITCATGFGDCNGNVDDGCETDTTANPMHCGMCGAVCDQCIGSRCVKNLATGLDPQNITIDATNVYIASTMTGDVVKVPIGGGMAVKLATGQGGPFDVAVDATNVYWTNSTGGTVMKVPIAGGNPVTLSMGQMGPSNIAVDATKVYWTNATSGEVQSVLIGGGMTTNLAMGQSQATGIAVDTTSVYFTARMGSTVSKVSTSGGMVTQLANGQGGPFGIVVDNANVYWTNNMANQVQRTPKMGGMMPTTQQNNQMSVKGIAIDMAAIYWVTSENVMRYTTGGGNVTQLASKQKAPTSVAVDNTSVYWSNTGDGTVVRMTPKN